MSLESATDSRMNDSNREINVRAAWQMLQEEGKADQARQLMSHDAGIWVRKTEKPSHGSARTRPNTLVEVWTQLMGNVPMPMEVAFSDDGINLLEGDDHRLDVERTQQLMHDQHEYRKRECAKTIETLPASRARGVEP